MTTIRDCVPGDLPFLQKMLYEAAHPHPGDARAAFSSCINDPVIARFWVDWPRSGDIGVVAEQNDGPEGAAWARQFSGDDRWPWDEPDIPVLVIAVRPEYRAVGVGRLLMAGLVERARAKGVPALDLTTHARNEAAMRLYRSCGFVEMDRFGTTVRARLPLGPRALATPRARLRARPRRAR